ncbi:MAG TPA: ATP-binding cassette domain-containing protein [Bryobacteraceae bacterium]|jgi:molybdate transport system ATP-binding protein|nr:ATP-binding cassette domain-containing protein [Bryobacteraceae bacterium]
MIQARIKKHFPQARGSAPFVLDVEFNAESGVTVLFGPSGAGKTLTLDAIAGFLRPDNGRILLDDMLLFDGASGICLNPQSRHCGYVFQNYALFPHMNLRENLAFAAERLPRLERHRKVQEMIARFRLDEVASRAPHELSGGQRQRGSIARALLAAPRLLLLDEPARGLDAPLRAGLYDVIREVRAGFQVPIVLVTHDLEECFALGDVMHVLNEGRIVQSGTPESIVERPTSLEVARLLGLYDLFEAEIRTLDPGTNSSYLRFGDFDLKASYLPGKFKGDRVWIYVLPERVRAVPRNGHRPASNQIPATVERIIERPHAIRLEFSNGLRADVARESFSGWAGTREWLIEYPPSELRAL